MESSFSVATCVSMRRLFWTKCGKERISLRKRSLLANWIKRGPKHLNVARSKDQACGESDDFVSFVRGRRGVCKESPPWECCCCCCRCHDWQVERLLKRLIEQQMHLKKEKREKLSLRYRIYPQALHAHPNKAKDTVFPAKVGKFCTQEMEGKTFLACRGHITTERHNTHYSHV